MWLSYHCVHVLPVTFLSTKELFHCSVLVTLRSRNYRHEGAADHRDSSGYTGTEHKPPMTQQHQRIFLEVLSSLLAR